MGGLTLNVSNLTVYKPTPGSCEFPKKIKPDWFSRFDVYLDTIL